MQNRMGRSDSGRPAGLAAALAVLALSTAGWLGSSGCSISPLRPEVSCPKLDWYEAGRRDGAEGKPLNAVAAESRECGLAHGDPDPDAYENGWNAGLTEYCTRPAGLEAGRSGQIYRHVCPEHLEPRFLSGYEAGARVLALETENAELTRRIDSAAQDLNSPAVAPAERPRLRTLLEDLRQRQTQIDQQIETAEAKAETASDAPPGKRPL